MRLSVNIQSCHIRLPVALGHAEEIPAVPFIETGMVCDEINGRDAFRFQVVNGHVEQMASNTLAAIFFFRINGADVRRKVFPVVEIIFDNAQTANNAVLRKA